MPARRITFRRTPISAARRSPRYTPRDFIALVEKHRIAYHEKKLGPTLLRRLARAQIIAMLKAECDRGGVQWRMPCAVDAVAREGEWWRIDTADGAVVAESLVIATGGLTVPKIGATPFGYEVAEQFGLAMVPPRPALVPLSLHPETLVRYGDLAGVSVDAEVSCGGGRFRENILFTHRGLSGPAILQISSYWNGKDPLTIDLLPDIDATQWLVSAGNAAALLPNVLAERLPARFAQQWCAAHGAAKPMRQIAEKRLRELAASLHAWTVVPSGTLGYNKAEVTRGGVDTRALSSKTMAATGVPRLFFIGEVVDVTGWLGGYNFQWAWSSGHAAGQFA